jgi:hypothetical protein
MFLMLICLSLTANAHGETARFFGPQKYLRTTAAPQEITNTFTAANAIGQSRLIVQNGEGKRGRISSAIVKLNGATVVGPNSFSQQVDSVSVPVTLREENTISVEIRSIPGTYITISVIGEVKPPVSPISGITIAPDAIFVGEPQYVTIRAHIPYNPDGSVPLVNLQRVDAANNVIATEGSLTDNGNLSAGDEVTGDGIFSIRKLFSSQIEQSIRLQIRLQQDPTQTSNVFVLDVFTHLTDTQVNNILNLQRQAIQNYNFLAGSIGKVAAANAVLTTIRENPNVLQAGLSESGNGIWMLYSSGVLGALNLNPPGTKGGTGGTGSFMTPLAHGTLLTQVQSLLAVQAVGTPPAVIDNRIKSKKAIVLSAFNSDFGDNDDAPAIHQILQSHGCLDVGPSVLNSAANVDVFKTLSQYGVIVISSHGDTYYNGLLSLWQEKWGWNGWFGQVAVLTGEQVTTANKAAREIDLKKGRLAINSGHSGGYYAILPSFIGHYGNQYPDSLVYMSACRSAFNNSLADAFLNRGAKTYLGYTEYVSAAFARQVGSHFFQEFLKEPEPLPYPTPVTTGTAFTPGLHDTNTPPAYFVLRGSTALEPPTAGLEDGGFETGVLGAWQTTGDGRVLSQLGGFLPEGGSYLGLISTGLGFTEASGSIAQKVCLPSDAKRLEFSWNFNSAEFREWCGSTYQDSFTVQIQTETGTHTLFSRKVDDLCGSVSPTTLVFDEGDVWSTGWQAQSIDISAIVQANQGKTVTIRFSVGDVGDSVFDTAVLLDQIRIVTE